MIDACRQAKVKLMIAYRIHFDATFQHVRQMVQAGALGEIEVFQGGFYGLKNKQEWRLKRALAGGGSLLDLGIYPLNTIRWILGEEPKEFRTFVYMRDKSGTFDEVEQSVEWMMKFPSGVMAAAGVRMGRAVRTFLQIDWFDRASAGGTCVCVWRCCAEASGRSAGEITGGGPVNDPDQFVSRFRTLRIAC
jgi:predicted dehydrogenase